MLFEGEGPTPVFDSLSGRFFKSDIETLRAAENRFNSNLLHHMYGSLNEYYTEIGLEPIGMGEDVGWNSDKLMEVDYQATLTEKGIPAIHLGFYHSMPKFDYTSNY